MKRKHYLLILILLLFGLPLFYQSCQGHNKAESNKNFTKDSQITISKYNSMTINNLAQLCKVWGFLKYHHPEVTQGKYNWDFELFSIMHSVLDIQTIRERNQLLSTWIKKLGEVEEVTDISLIDSSQVKIFPDLTWINDPTFGNLSKLLEKITQTNIYNKSYYIEFPNQIGNPSFINENDYSDFKYPDTGYRLLSLFRYWNIIQYYYPYRHLIGENWHDVLIEFIPLFIDAKNEMEYKLVIQKLISRINDTHAGTSSMGSVFKHYAGDKFPAITISFIENQAVIVDFFEEKYSKECSLRKGDIILSIDNKTVDTILKERQPYISASNYPAFLRNIAQVLLLTNKDEVMINYSRNGELYTEKVKTYPAYEDIELPSLHRKPIPCYQILEDNISYIYPGSTIEGDIPENISTKGMIIDLRCYPDSKTVKGYWEFLQLYSEPTDFVKFTRGSIQHPGLFTFSGSIRVGESNTNYYKGKKVILVNELTQSHAEFMAMKYRCAPNTIVIGSTTAGADGNVSYFFLPGGIRTLITGIGIYYPNGQETQRIGIIPDIEVKPTIKGFLEDRDEVLEKAIEIIQKTAKNDSLQNIQTSRNNLNYY